MFTDKPPDFLVPLAQRWRQMTEPTQPFDSRDTQNRARLITRILLVSSLICLVLGLLLLMLTSAFEIRTIQSVALLGSGVVVFGLSRLSRSIQPTWSALSILTFALVMIFGIALLRVDQDGNSSLYYLTMTVFFAGSFFSLRWGISVMVLQTALMLGFALVTSISLLDLVLGPFSFYLLMSAALLLIIYQYQRLNQERLAALRTGEEKFRRVLASISDAVYMYKLDKDDRLYDQYVSSQTEDITGRSIAEFLADPKRWSQIIHPDDQAIANQQFARLLRGESSETEYRMVHRDGSIIWVRDSARCETDPLTGDRIVYGVVSDITQRKQTLAELEQERKLLRTLLDAIPDPIFVKSLDNRYLNVNQKMLEHRRMTDLADIIGKPGEEIYHDLETQDAFRREIEIIQRGEAIYNREEFVTNANGDPCWLSTSRVPLRDPDGNIIGLVGISRDITELKQTQQLLETEHNLLQTLFNTLPDPVFIKDRDRRFVRVNQAMATHMQAASPDEMIGKTDEDYHQPKMAARFKIDDMQVMDAGIALLSYEEPNYHRPGETRWLLTTKVPLRNSDGDITGLVGILRDITERRNIEEHYRIISDAIADFAFGFRIEPDGTHSNDWLTESFTRRIGYTWADLQLAGRYMHIHPDDRDAVEEAVAKVAQGIANDGEHRIVTRSGELRWYHVYRYPVRDELTGKIVRYYGVGLDITERKHAEARIIEAAIAEERLETTRKFIRAVGHDFRNTLATIETSRDLITMKLQRHAPTMYESVQNNLQTISENVNRLADQIDNLSTIGRMKELELAPQPINQLVEILIDQFEARAERKQQTIRFTPDPKLPETMIDRDKIYQALKQLLFNAIDYTPAGGQIDIVTTTRSADHEYVVIEISDTGAGIDARHLPHLFDEFYKADQDESRTIDVGGMGMGLSIVHMITEAHNGKATVESVVGEGSTFAIWLPVTANATSVMT